MRGGGGWGVGGYEIVFSDNFVEFGCEAFGGSAISDRFLEFGKEFRIHTTINLIVRGNKLDSPTVSVFGERSPPLQ